MTEDQDIDNSSLLDDFFALPLLGAKPLPKPLPKPTSQNSGSLLEPGCQLIKGQSESLHTPFVHISDAICNSLQDAERIQDSLEELAARLRDLAHREAVKQKASIFDPEAEEGRDSGKEDLLECIWRMMVVEATMLKSASKRPIRNNGNGA
jgi:hypothetical protein